MRDRVKRSGTGLLMAIILLGGFCVGASAQQADESRILKLFEKGISHYEKEEYAPAQAAFEELLSLRPGSRVALQMRKKVEVGQLAEMMAEEELAPAADRIRKLMDHALRQQKRSLEDIDQVMEDFQSTDIATYGKALNRIMGYGRYAVPRLLEFLALEGKQNQRLVIRARMAISRMHRDAIFPLMEALASDNDLLKTRVIELLGHLGDRRAVPTLLAIVQKENALSTQRKAARQAIQNITDSSPEELARPVEAYADLAEAYLQENHDVVGYFDAAEGEIWQWNAGADGLSEKVTYRLVPNYLYFPSLGVETALEGLELRPEDKRLQALVLALVTVQLSRCEMMSSDEVSTRLGEDLVTGEMKQDAARRLGDLQKRWPLLGRVSSPAVVGRALELALDAGEGDSALRLVKLLGDKTGLTPEEAGKSLMAALDAGDKEVRYHAAVQIVQHAPLGEFGYPEKVMKVLSATLKSAAAKTSLLIFDNLNLRNRLTSIIRDKGMTTVGCAASPGRVNMSLNIQPSIDIIFLTADLPQGQFERLFNLLKQDIRTRTIPLYVVTTAGGADVADYAGITAVLSPGLVHRENIGSILEQKVLDERPAEVREKREALLLQAAQAVERLQPAATAYPLGMLEPALLDALRGYSEEVEKAVLRTLARIGTYDSVDNVARLIGDPDASTELRVLACRTVASVLRRADQPAGEKVVALIKDALAGDSALLRQAAAEALGAAGLKPSDSLRLQAQYTQIEPGPAPGGVSRPAGEGEEKQVTAPPPARKEEPAEEKPKPEPTEEVSLMEAAPAGTVAVGSLNFGRMRAAGLTRQGGMPVPTGDFPLDITSLVGGVGLVFGDPSSPGQPPTQAAGIIRHSAALSDVKSGFQQSGLSPQTIQGLEAYPAPDGQGIIAIADDQTLFVASDEQALGRIAAFYRSKGGSAGVANLLMGKAGSALQFEAQLSDQLRSTIAQDPQAPDMMKELTGAVGKVDVTPETLSVDADMTFTGAGAADQMAGMLTAQLNQAKAQINTQLQQMGQASGQGPQQQFMQQMKTAMQDVLDVLDRIKISSKESTVTVDFQVGTDQLQKLLQGMMMQMMAPMGPGSGGPPPGFGGAPGRVQSQCGGTACRARTVRRHGRASGLARGTLH